MTDAKPRGRPPEGAKRKTASLNLKASDELRALIQAAALEGGRSLTQEIERRLASTFAVSASAMTAGVGPLLRRMATVVDLTEQRTGKAWDADPETFWAVRAGFNDLVDRIMPQEPDWAASVAAGGDGSYADKIEDWKTLGREIARAVQPLPTRHPGHVNPDGTVTPVASLAR